MFLLWAIDHALQYKPVMMDCSATLCRSMERNQPTFFGNQRMTEA
jgi:hypothetical protein